MTFLSCGPSATTSNSDEKDTKLAANTNSSSNTRELITVPVVVGAKKRSSLNFTAEATAFTIDIDSCVSGLQSTISEASSQVFVYRNDRSCLAKLTSFTYLGNDYVPSAGDPFSTWQAGDSAVFEDTLNAANTLDVLVVSTLQSPIGVGDSIEYQFSSTKAGSSITGILAAEVSAAATAPSGTQSPPSFSVVQTAFTGQSASNEGKFEFKLECSAMMVGSVCIDVDLSAISYALVYDSYGGIISSQDGDAIFGSAGTSIDTLTEQIPPGSDGLTNGGFKTKTGASVLLGPVDIVTKPNMILILRALGSDASYQYFNVDLKLNVGG